MRTAIATQQGPRLPSAISFGPPHSSPPARVAAAPAHRSTGLITVPDRSPSTSARSGTQHDDDQQPHSRRRVLGGALATAVGAAALAGGWCPCCGNPARAALSSTSSSSSAVAAPEVGWYEELFAYALNTCDGTYREALAPLKEQLFAELAQQLLPSAPSGGSPGDGGAAAEASADGVGGVPAAEGVARDAGERRPLRVLEIGVGGAPNLGPLVAALRRRPGGEEAVRALRVVGVDKNAAMQKYARQVRCRAGAASASAG